MNVGRNLAVLRDQKGLTQEALAAKTGISQKQIEAYEGGCKSPDLDTLEKFSVALECSVEVLITGAQIVTVFCPLNSLPCQQEGCAWYLPEHKTCAVCRIARGYAAERAYSEWCGPVH